MREHVRAANLPPGGAVGRAIRILAVAVFLLLIVLAVRAWRMDAPQVAAVTVAPMPLDEAALAERLGGALRIPTISNQDGAGRDDAAFAAFHAYLEGAYPHVHENLARERVGDWSLLYTWQGRDPSLAPILLLAHQDVVPVEEGTEGAWEQPPFSGNVAGGFVWGRGALDDKVNITGHLEAVESLLTEGFQLERTVYLAYGHDEELGGADGATRIAELLASRDVAPLLVLDEGGAILPGAVPGVTAPVAAIGVGEKGYLSVELVAEGPGGHSSTPPRQTSISILAEAILSLQRNPMPARLEGPTRDVAERAGAHATFPYRMVYANLWLFRPLVERLIARVPAADATIRTTLAPTILDAGLKDNVIPSRARAVVNFRLLPGDGIDEVVAWVTGIVDDPRVTVRAMSKRREATAPSPASGEAWDLLARSIREMDSEVVVAPYLLVGGTDARHYAGLTPNVLRFMPLRLDVEDTKRIHGTNERVSVAGYADLVRFYRRLLENATRPAEESGS